MRDVRQRLVCVAVMKERREGERWRRDGKKKTQRKRGHESDESEKTKVSGNKNRGKWRKREKKKGRKNASTSLWM